MIRSKSVRGDHPFKANSYRMVAFPTSPDLRHPQVCHLHYSACLQIVLATTDQQHQAVAHPLLASARLVHTQSCGAASHRELYKKTAGSVVILRDIAQDFFLTLVPNSTITIDNVDSS